MAANERDEPTDNSKSPTQPRAEPDAASTVPQYKFEDLAQGDSPFVRIMCAGKEYILRRTKAGKLVLNK